MALILCVGGAYDLSTLTKAKASLQDVVDTAALAGASTARVDRQNRRKSARKVFDTNLSLSHGLILRGRPRIVFDDSAKEVTVSAKVRVKPAFMGIIGINKFKIEAKSTSGYAIEGMNPFAVMLALDVSGSMGMVSSDGEVKLDALKSATDEMFQSLYSTSENPTLLLSTIRTGFASYNTELDTTRVLNTGYFDTVADVRNLVAIGGTRSTPAVQYAYDALRTERGSRTNWSGYLVFMTDGDNNDPTWDDDTLAVCDTARADKITIFTIAFEAPANGVSLLKACADDRAHFYKSTNARKLRRAFRDIGREISQSVVRIKR